MKSKVKQAINRLAEFKIKTEVKIHKSGVKLNMIILENLKNEKRLH
jgi:hypothetical protein